MEIGFMFLFNSVLLGVGLAMDAFSVSLANGLNEPNMKKSRMCGIAGVFAFFQALMPMVGWVCIHTIVNTFQAFEKCIPWIALALLGFIGGKMLLEGIRGGDEDEDGEKAVGFMGLMVQGVATSIDALSVGFTIADDEQLAINKAFCYVCVILINILYRSTMCRLIVERNRHVVGVHSIYLYFEFATYILHSHCTINQAVQLQWVKVSLCIQTAEVRLCWTIRQNTLTC